MSDIPDEHFIRAFVIETGNLKDGFQKACEHIATVEATNARLQELEQACIRHYVGEIDKAEWRIAVRNSPEGQRLAALARQEE